MDQTTPPAMARTVMASAALLMARLPRQNAKMSVSAVDVFNLQDRVTQPSCGERGGGAAMNFRGFLVGALGALLAGYAALLLYVN
jgi:hypothetical protein